MAANIDSDRQPRNMCGPGENPDRKGGRTSAETGGADPGCIDPAKCLLFNPADMGQLRVGINRERQRLFGQQGTFFKGSADTGADHHRRAGVGACIPRCIHDGLNDAFLAPDAERFELRLGLWDFAAGAVIAEEAGCVITDIDGRPLTYDGPSSVLAVSEGVAREPYLPEK